MDAAGPSYSLPDLSAARGSTAARVAAWLGPRFGESGGLSMGDDTPRLDEEDPSAWIADIAARRSRESFALLFSRFAPRVKSYLLKLGARPALAEELAQETLLTVWRKAAYFDPNRASAATWIFTIARNLRIDALRREHHPEALENEPELVPDEEQPADAIIVALQRLNRVRQALGDLSADQVEVVRLSFFEEKPHSEISEDLGLPLGTVKSRLRLAMARLRTQLEDLL
jgi:RNA polymerase sigma-70 factor (ECF subfamily)